TAAGSFAQRREDPAAVSRLDLWCPRQVLAEARRPQQLAILHDDLSANDRARDLSAQCPSLIRAEAALAVEVLASDSPFRIRIEDHQVGVGADRDAALARRESEHSCRLLT